MLQDIGIGSLAASRMGITWSISFDGLELGPDRLEFAETQQGFNP
jgi:hypothetical protein